MKIKITLEPIKKNLEKELKYEIKKINEKFNIKIKINSKLELTFKTIKEFKKSIEILYLHSYLIKKIKIDEKSLKEINENQTKIDEINKILNKNELTLLENKQILTDTEIELIKIIINSKLNKFFEKNVLYLNLDSIKYSITLFKFFNRVPIYKNFRNRFQTNYFKIFKFNEKINRFQNKNNQFSILNNKNLKEIKEISSKENIKLSLSILRPDFIEFKYEENKFNLCFIENISKKEKINLNKIIEQLKYIIKKDIIIITNKNNSNKQLNQIKEIFKKNKLIELDKEIDLISIKK